MEKTTKWLIWWLIVMGFINLVLWFTIYENSKLIQKMQYEILTIEQEMPTAQVEEIRQDLTTTIGGVIDMINEVDIKFQEKDAQVKLLAEKLISLIDTHDKNVKTYNDWLKRHDNSIQGLLDVINYYH